MCFPRSFPPRGAVNILRRALTVVSVVGPALQGVIPYRTVGQLFRTPE